MSTNRLIERLRAAIADNDYLCIGLALAQYEPQWSPVVADFLLGHFLDARIRTTMRGTMRKPYPVPNLYLRLETVGQVGTAGMISGVKRGSKGVDDRFHCSPCAARARLADGLSVWAFCGLISSQRNSMHAASYALGIPYGDLDTPRHARTAPARQTLPSLPLVP